MGLLSTPASLSYVIGMDSTLKCKISPSNILRRRFVQQDPLASHKFGLNLDMMPSKS